VLNAEFFNSDGTVLTGTILDQILGGDLDTPYAMGIRNTGDEAWPSTYSASIIPVGLSDGADELRIGLDPDVLSRAPVLLGAVAPAGEVVVYIGRVVPMAVDARRNPRRALIRLAP